jgi:hypothetical protein
MSRQRNATFNLYITQHKTTGDRRIWKFAVAPPNRIQNTTFYYAGRSRSPQRTRQLSPPVLIVDIGQALNDENMIDVEILCPPITNFNQFKSIVTSEALQGLENRPYIIGALILLEEAGIVCTGTYRHWQQRLACTEALPSSWWAPSGPAPSAGSRAGQTLAGTDQSAESGAG